MLLWSVACEANWLREEQSTLNSWEESAEGIVAGGNEPGLPRSGDYPEDSPRRRPERWSGPKGAGK